MLFSSLKEFCIINKINFFYSDKVSSTMDIAKKDAHLDNRMSIFICNQQTNGRGRGKHKWISNHGNIFFTIKIFPKNIIDKFYELGVLSSIEIKKTLKEFHIYDVFFKWPNDIYVEKNKIGGILTEICQTHDRLFCLIGIGLNFTSSPKLTKYKTSFIKNYNMYIDREKFVLSLIKNLIFCYNEWNKTTKNTFLKNYKKSLMYLGKKVLVKTNTGELIKGKFVDINNKGFLIIQNNYGKKTIMAGSLEPL